MADWAQPAIGDGAADILRAKVEADAVAARETFRQKAERPRIEEPRTTVFFDRVGACCRHMCLCRVGIAGEQANVLPDRNGLVAETWQAGIG
ncbi:hypothetical protein [uncultured Sphingomonas sp.]|uniref:hypothetical protein n=1 Tax=uncultured Sphingomonas sp. TaxID=158754 RepID=UPI0025DD2CD4|nr:hypothetical protein [uncultured Sphingomonas sp.]